MNKDGEIIPDLESLTEVDSFGNTAVQKGLRAVGMRIVNLLFQEKGTCFDDFDMGVGIKLYLYERAGDKLLAELSAEIETQIQRYLQDIDVDKAELEYMAPEKLKQAVAGGTLLVKLKFRQPVEGKNYLALKIERDEKKDHSVTIFAD